MGAYESIEEIAGRYDYAISRGVESAESDSRMGINDIVDAFQLSAVAVLRAPRDYPAPLAPAIQKGLVEWEMKGIRPAFFDFLLDLSKALRRFGATMVVSFSSEWEAGDYVRLRKGMPEELVEFLKGPGHWCLQLYRPTKQMYNNDDEIPLVYVVSL